MEYKEYQINKQTKQNKNKWKEQIGDYQRERWLGKDGEIDKEDQLYGDG